MTTRQILFLLILFNILCWVTIIYGCYLLWR